MIRKLLIAALSLLMSANTSAATTCSEKFSASSRADLTLPFKEFDQAESSGWRPLADAGCFLEAAELIKRYVALQPQPDAILHWHLAQSLAFGGKRSEAVKIGKEFGLRPADDVRKFGYQWNEFALATIAYWQADKPEFMRQKALLESAISKKPNVPALGANKALLDALTSLDQCFDLPYAKAVDCKHEP